MRGEQRIACVIACALLLAAFPRAAHGEDGAMIVALIVDGVHEHDVVVVAEADDILVARDDLEAAHIARLDAPSRALLGTEYVSLHALSIPFHLDRAASTLELSLSPDRLPATRVDFARVVPPLDRVEEPNLSAFANYAVHAARSSGTTTVDGYGEAGMRFDDTLAQTAVSVLAGHHVVRGLSALVRDRRDELDRIAVGDQLVTGGTLGGSELVGGIHLRRSFELDPYLVTTPVYELHGDLLAPSMAEVYVNGLLVRRVALAPGHFDFTNLPVTSGPGQVTVVLRDALGREQVLGSTFFRPAGLLRPGLSDYQFAAGARRDDYGTESWDYGVPVVLARYRRGLTSDITAGGNAEVSREVAAGGVTLTTSMPVGLVEVSANASTTGGAAGSAGALAWAYGTRRASGFAFVRAASARYATTDGYVHPRFDGHLGASASIGPASAGLTFEAADHVDIGATSRAALTLSWQAGGGLVLGATAGRSTREHAPVAYDAFLTASASLGHRTRAALTATRDPGGSSERVDVQRTLPRADGYGYHVFARTGSEELASIQDQTGFGRYELAYDRVGSSTNVDATAAGGIVWIGGALHATRPVDRGFTLVRVPGVAGIRTYVENHELGRTDKDGDILVVDALPYYHSRVAIALDDLPVDRVATRTTAFVAPPDRGGVIVTFPVHIVRVVRGSLRVHADEGWVVPAYGELVVGEPPSFRDPEAEYFVSPIGDGGEFEIDGIAGGSYRARVVWNGRARTCTLFVPVRDAPVVDLGEIDCEEGAP